jgi:hypothetical protein
MHGRSSKQTGEPVLRSGDAQPMPEPSAQELPTLTDRVPASDELRNYGPAAVKLLLFTDAEAMSGRNVLLRDRLADLCGAHNWSAAAPAARSHCSSLPLRTRTSSVV